MPPANGRCCKTIGLFKVFKVIIRYQMTLKIHGPFCDQLHWQQFAHTQTQLTIYHVWICLAFPCKLKVEFTLLPIATHLLAGIRTLRFVTQKFHEISICLSMLATKMSWDAEPQPDKPTSPSLNSNGSSNFRLSRNLVHLLTEMPWPYHLGTDNPIRSWMRGLWLGKKYKGTAVSISTTIEMHATTFIKTTNHVRQIFWTCVQKNWTEQNNVKRNKAKTRNTKQILGPIGHTVMGPSTCSPARHSSMFASAC